MLTPEQHEAFAYRVQEAVRTGSIETADRKTLIEYSTWFCEPGAANTMNDSAVYEQSCELVRLHMLRTFMEELERRGARIQRIVLWLAVAAIIGTGFQTWYGYKAEKRSEAESEATAQQRNSQQSLSSAPTPAKPPSSSPATSTRASSSPPAASASRASSK